MAVVFAVSASAVMNGHQVRRPTAALPQPRADSGGWCVAVGDPIPTLQKDDGTIVPSNDPAGEPMVTLADWAPAIPADEAGQVLGMIATTAVPFQVLAIGTTLNMPLPPPTAPALVGVPIGDWRSTLV